MTLHIIKLSVGTDSLDDLVTWQKQVLAQKRKTGITPELMHVTRMTPKRADEVLDGGSIYWVIKGFIAGRQRLLDLRPVKKNGVPHCALVLDPEMVPVRMTPKKAFQGWRYLDPKDAPPDRRRNTHDDDLPESLKRELAALGLL